MEQDFRENDGEETTIKRLINEAYLEFYIDESITGTDADHPNRIFVYDLNNNVLIFNSLDSSLRKVKINFNPSCSNKC